MRRILAILIALTIMVQGTALAGSIVFTTNNYETSGDFSWSYTIGQHGNALYVFFRLYDHGVMTAGYSVAEDPTQPIAPMEYELESEIPYNYFPSGNQIGAYSFLEDGYFHLYDVAFDVENAISHEEIASFDYIGADMPYFYPLMPVICGDYFVCASMSETGAYSLYALDMPEGTMRETDTDDENALINVVGICPYDDESVIVATQDVDLGPTVSFYLYTPEDGALAQATVISMDQVDMTFSTPAYDPETDTIYYIIDDTLYAMTGFDQDTITALPDYQGECFCMQNGQALVLNDSYYVVSDGTTLCAASLNPDAVVEPAQNELTIYSRGEEDVVYNTINAYGRDKGGATVQYITERPAGSSISADIIAQSGAIDLYMIETNSAEYAALVNRGYLLPIESDEIQSFVDRMYPQMRDEITRDGQALALPVNFDVSCISYNPAVFSALGLTEDDVPETWMELLTLLQRMPELVADTDYAVFGAWNIDYYMRSRLANAIITDFCQRYVAGEALDTAQLSALITELDEIDFTSMGLSTDPDNRQDGDDENTVFFLSNEISLRRDDGFFLSMPLALQEGMQGVIDGEMTVVILNPYSTNQEAAIAFLETMLDNVPATVQASVCADWEGGVKMDGADDFLQSAEDNIAAIQAELEVATDEDEIEQYQALLDEALASKDRVMDRFYWEVSPDLLEKYQEMAGKIGVVTYLGLDFSAEIVPIIDKYLDGGLTADAMISHVINKLNIAIHE